MASITVVNANTDLSGNTLITEENAYTITGLHTFSRTTNAPFAVNSGAAVVANLDADLLDGQQGSYYLAAANFTGTLAVNRGGTGAATFTDGGVLLGSGTGAISAMAVLADGEMIVGDGTTDPVAESGATLRTSIGVGTGDSPQFTGVNVGHASDTTVTRASSGDLNVEGNLIYRAGGTDVPVSDGGTGASTFTDGGVLLGSGTSAITATAVLGDGEILIGDASGDPTTLDVGSSTAITTLGTVSTGVWQGTDVGVAYGGTGVSTFTDKGVLYGQGASAVLVTAAGSEGQLLRAGSGGTPAFTTINAVNPPGAIVMYAATSAPTGYLLCEGSNVSRTTYSDLFAAIGTNYGVGDGSSTFGLPNLEGRFPIGYDASTYLLNGTGGATADTPTLSGTNAGTALTEANLPAHAHDTWGSGWPTGSWTGGTGTTQSSVTQASGTLATATTLRTLTTGSGTTHTHTWTGTSTAVDTVPPYLVVNYIIKT